MLSIFIIDNDLNFDKTTNFGATIIILSNNYVLFIFIIWQFHIGILLRLVVSGFNIEI